MYLVNKKDHKGSQVIRQEERKGADRDIEACITLPVSVFHTKERVSPLSGLDNVSGNRICEICSISDPCPRSKCDATHAYIPVHAIISSQGL